MAIALLLQSNQIKSDEIDKYAFIGELSLNGDLRPCVGVLPINIFSTEGYLIPG